MDQEDLERTLKAHKQWLDGDDNGVRAEIIGADFSGAAANNHNRLRPALYHQFFDFHDGFSRVQSLWTGDRAI
jgi:hypothetical protein